jgi:hypothetical protein
MPTRRPRALPWRALGVLAVTGLFVSFAPVVAQAAPHHAMCRAIALPVPAGTTTSTVNGGAPTGRYLVGVGDGTGLVWRDGRVTSIDAAPLAPAIRVDFNDINSHGVVVGERMTDSNTFHTDAFVYRAGRFTLLRAPDPGDVTQAVAINSRGEIVGNAYFAAAWHPVVWREDRPGSVRVLPIPAGGGYAGDIDDDGTVVGYLAPWPPGTLYVWPVHGAPHALPVPAGSIGGNAVSIRSGMVAGNVFDPVTGSTVATVWHLRTGIITKSAVQGAALSVNRWGTLGSAGAIVHADGRVVPVVGWVFVVTDQGLAAGTNKLYIGQAVVWRGC